MVTTSWTSERRAKCNRAPRYASTSAATCTSPAGLVTTTLNFLDTKVHGRHVDLQTGTGNDKIELTRVEAARAQLLAELGDGDDTLTIANGAYILAKRLWANGGRGHDDFEFGTGVTRLPWLTLGNFEV